METIHRVDPTARTVCCSTGTSRWLQYDKRLFDAGLLKDIDVLSLHPYRPGPPEPKQGAFTFIEEINAPVELAKTVGVTKPVWATEANWIIGPAGSSNITAAGLSETDQAKYVVRTNILSDIEGVNYFLHAPFEHTLRPHVHVETLAAYANMSAMLSGTSNRTLLASGPDLWAVYFSSGSGYVGALWSVTPAGRVRLSGAGLKLFDIYGNPLDLDPNSLAVSDAPIYFRSSSPPSLDLVAAPRALIFKSATALTAWTCQSQSRCSQEGGNNHVVSQPTQYAYQLISAPFSVSTGSCQVARVTLALRQGSVGFFAVDAATNKTLGNVVYTTFLPDGKARELHLRFNAGPASAVKLVLAAANPQAAVSEFITSNPAIANCP
jgi:hypothetical protein